MGDLVTGFLVGLSVGAPVGAVIVLNVGALTGAAVGTLRPPSPSEAPKETPTYVIKMNTNTAISELFFNGALTVLDDDSDFEDILNATRLVLYYIIFI